MDGVYLLANDAVLPWAKIFLESFRRSNPTLPLQVIPFDDRMDEISMLADLYHFQFLRGDFLETLDEIGKIYSTNEGTHVFRLMAGSWGCFDRFMVFGTDMAVLQNLQELFDVAAPFSPGFFYQQAMGDESVYTSPLREIMHGRSVGFNSGGILLSKATLTPDDILASAGRALPWKQCLRHAYEEAFFNFCIDMKPVLRAGFHDLIPRLSGTSWGGYQYKIDGESPYPLGPCRLVDGKGQDHNIGKEVFAIHWAGFDSVDSAPNQHIIRMFR